MKKIPGPSWVLLVLISLISSAQLTYAGPEDSTSGPPKPSLWKKVKKSVGGATVRTHFNAVKASLANKEKGLSYSDLVKVEKAAQKVKSQINLPMKEARARLVEHVKIEKINKKLKDIHGDSDGPAPRIRNQTNLYRGSVDRGLDQMKEIEKYNKMAKTPSPIKKKVKLESTEDLMKSGEVVSDKEKRVKSLPSPQKNLDRTTSSPVLK